MKQSQIITIAALIASSCAAQAAPGSCYLSVGGHVYLDGSCNVDLTSDGSFSIGTGDTDRLRSRYFAYVNIDPETKKADGSWNGVDAESHAHDPLGTLTRSGGCWSNNHAKVCAWTPGTRPRDF